MKASELFQLPASLEVFKFHFPEDALPWEWLPNISKALEDFDFDSSRQSLKIPSGLSVGDCVFIDPSVQLPAYGVIEGPAYIGKGCQLRPGVYIRQNVIAGEGCVLGHASEFKNTLLMDNVEAPHFNYVGDSVLGSGAHLGAGAVLANLRLDRKEVVIHIKGDRYPTGLKKLGGILGEGAEVLCNAVLQPGSVLGKRSVLMPGVVFGGYLADAKMVIGELSASLKQIDRV